MEIFTEYTVIRCILTGNILIIEKNGEVFIDIKEVIKFNNAMYLADQLSQEWAK